MKSGSWPWTAATGKLLWSQQLAMVESNITQDPIRRLAGVSPSYSDGVLICPTGAGCVVAVDLATRSLLWGYVYSHPGEQQPTGTPPAADHPFQNAFNNANGPVPRWLDGTAMIVNGRVLLTPAEADALYCLNLADGKPAWASSLAWPAASRSSTSTSPVSTRGWWCWSAAARSTPSTSKTAARPGAAVHQPSLRGGLFAATAFMPAGSTSCRLPAVR